MELSRCTGLQARYAMLEKDSYCSYCGNEFPGTLPWPRTCPSCGSKTYLNPLPVAVMLLPMHDGLVVMRRNTEPCKGTLTLPGGYIDFGETWQEAGRRELFEETGIDVGCDELRLYEVGNGLDGTLVIFGLAEQREREWSKEFTSEETQEVRIIDGPMELGFEMHTKIVARYFAEKGG